MKNRYIPFGYQIQNGDSVINTEQAATVQHIFYAYTEGQSFKEIAEYLTTSGTAYHFSDNSWNKNIVARILANEIYCGAKGYPAIISKEVYSQAASIRSNKTVTYSAVLKPFRSDMQCACCGERLLHQAILKAVQNLAANFTDEVAAQLDGILRQMKAGENLKAQLQKQLEKAQQEFDRLLEMSLELDESTPFLDDKLRKLSGKIKILKANIAESTDGKGEDEEATKQLTAQDLLIKEYDDILTARIIEKVIVHSRQEIEIYFIGGYTQKIDLI